MSSEQIMLSGETAAKKMQRMAYEIIEHNPGVSALYIGGIRDNGVIIAKKIGEFLEKIFNGDIHLFEIAIDKKNPQKISITSETDFNGKVVIIADDVANSGRTLLYATKPFLNFYPKKIQTLALVERSYKEFPVAPDYVGLSVSTASDEKIIVETKDGEVAHAWLATAEDLAKI